MATKTNETRAAEVKSLAAELRREITTASKTPDDPTAWVAVATLAGSIQRRSRLLAGLGRGG